MRKETECSGLRDTAKGNLDHLSVTGISHPFFRRPVLVATVALLAAAAVVGALIWWFQARQYETTDDAFIDARTVSISSQVSGAIGDVPVMDNQLVDAGAVLVRIDDRDYKTALDQAKAQVDEAKANLQVSVDAVKELLVACKGIDPSLN